MAQFKEYVKNDFLYSIYGGDQECNPTSSDNNIINNISFDALTGDTNKEKMADFMSKTPYHCIILPNGEFKIIGAKIQFYKDNSSDSASKWLGYDIDNISHILPYTFPNPIKGTSSKKNYGIMNGLSIDDETYKDYNDMVKHLNDIKLGFKNEYKQELTKYSLLYYKFELVDKKYIKVSDLICETQPDTTIDNLGPYDDKSITKSFSITVDGIPIEFNVTIRNKRNGVFFTPLGTESAQTASSLSVITAHGVGVLNVQRCKKTVNVKTGGNTDIPVKKTGEEIYTCDLNKYCPTFQLIIYKETGKNEWFYKLMFSANTYYYYKDASTFYKLSDFSFDPEETKALCNNKQKANEIIEKTQNHSGAGQRYIDAQGFSDTSLMNIFNLGIGIIGAAIFISKTYK